MCRQTADTLYPPPTPTHTPQRSLLLTGWRSQMLAPEPVPRKQGKLLPPLSALPSDTSYFHYVAWSTKKKSRSQDFWDRLRQLLREVISQSIRVDKTTEGWSHVTMTPGEPATAVCTVPAPQAHSWEVSFELSWKSPKNYTVMLITNNGMKDWGFFQPQKHSRSR